MYVYIYIYIHTCIYIYIYIHTHTHTYISYALPHSRIAVTYFYSVITPARAPLRRPYGALVSLAPLSVSVWINIMYIYIYTCLHHT